MHQMKLWIKRNKKIVKDITDRTPGLFIDDKLNANDQIFKNTTDNFFNLPSQVQQQLNDTVLKKLKQNQFLKKQHLKKIFQLFLNKLFQKRKILLLMMINLMNIKSLQQYVLNNQTMMTEITL